MYYLRWRRARYALPALVIAAVGGGALVPNLSGATSPPQLPGQTPAQLLAAVAQAKAPALSGTLSWTANVGLSDLSTLQSELGGGSSAPDGASPGGFNPLSLLSGSYQADIWLDGAKVAHIAFSQSPTEESDLVRNGNDVWLWQSTNETVTHLVFEGAATGTAGSYSPSGLPLTPAQLASQLLAKLSPTTSVTSGLPLYVAGQPAYQLIIAPNGAPGTTVDQVVVDIGAQGALSGTVLQVSVFAAGQSGPALQLGFTSPLDVGTPPSQELTFSPPAGSKVVTHYVDAQGWSTANRPSGQLGLHRIGTGWATVVSGTAAGLATAGTQANLAPVTTPLMVGGQQARLFSTNLLNVLVMPGGHFYAGFVKPAVLEADAAASASA